MGLGEAVKQVWDRVAGGVAGVDAAGAAEGKDARKTTVAPLGAGSIYAPFRATGMQNALPKPTAANLRRFAETPVARRAINCIKDRIACMDWRIEASTTGMSAAGMSAAGMSAAGTRAAGPGTEAASPFGDAAERIAALTRAFESPNEGDSFRTLIEQVIEDVLVGGFGAAEVDLTGDPARPVRLYPVDGASIQVNAHWTGAADDPRYAQVTGRLGSSPGGKGPLTPLLDAELMYVRLNPRSHTVFGLGKVEVAFESISNFLQAHRYAGRLASNSVAQYALWLNERTPEQHERLIRWWQDEVEGTGRVPILSSESRPEVLRFAAGTDADLRLQWQEFLLSMIANAFDLPAMMLGVSHDVNRSTATELANEAFQNAVVPLARLVAEHLTRDVIAKRLGWNDLRFAWNGLESRDELVEVEIQTKLLAAGVLSVEEVRRMRGLPVPGPE